jgi:hypothetical protein
MSELLLRFMAPGVLIMPSNQIEKFVQLVAEDHKIAERIKILHTHYHIVAFANSIGFDIHLSAWARYLAFDWLQLSDSQLQTILQADPEHWSWAFRQISKWHPLLMDGVKDSGLFEAIVFDVSGASKAAFSVGDNALECFIEAIRNRPDIVEQIRLARNEDEVINIAFLHGYVIDSLSILRKWSDHTDFSKPTWYGWF